LYPKVYILCSFRVIIAQENKNTLTLIIKVFDYFFNFLLLIDSDDTFSNFTPPNEEVKEFFQR